MESEKQRRRCVWEAADRVAVRTGRAPTVADVRREAGTDQNFTAKVMREWRSSRLHAAVTVGNLMPEALRAEMDRMLDLVWDRASQAAKEKSDAAVAAEADAQRCALVADAQALSTQVDMLEEQLAAARDRDRDLTARAAAAERSAEEASRRELLISEAHERALRDRDQLRDRPAALHALRCSEARRTLADVDAALEHLQELIQQVDELPLPPARKDNLPALSFRHAARDAVAAKERALAEKLKKLRMEAEQALQDEETERSDSKSGSAVASTARPGNLYRLESRMPSTPSLEA